MTFIDWSDPAEMLGLLVEYVVDERNDARNAARCAWLGDLAAELSGLAERYDAIPPEDLIARMREIFDTRPSEFEGDPVRTHLADCIAELERIRSEDGA